MNNNYSTGSLFSLSVKLSYHMLLTMSKACAITHRQYGNFSFGNNRCGLLVFGGELLMVSE